MLIINEKMNCCFCLKDDFAISFGETKKNGWVVYLIKLGGYPKREYWLKECKSKIEAETAYKRIVLALESGRKTLSI